MPRDCCQDSRKKSQVLTKNTKIKNSEFSKLKQNFSKKSVFIKILCKL